MSKIRMLRVIEYIGDREFMDEIIKQDSIKGEARFAGKHGSMIIKSSYIGSVPELLKPHEEAFKHVGTRCSICLEPQYKTPSGVTCKNGHGGAPPHEGD
jgi:hypothetical protein